MRGAGTLRSVLFAAALPCIALQHSSAEEPDAASTSWSVEFSMQPRDEAMHPWTVRLDANGAGSYSEQGQASPKPLNISKTTLERIRQGERRANNGRCETRQKNIANTGQKTVRYISPQRTASCTFNFSDDSGLMSAAGAFEGIAQTMQAGERLEHDQRFDRLSLDVDMDQLLTGVKNGGAIEVGNIAPALQSLVDDDHVIDRVRRKAARLLQEAGVSEPASAADLTAR